MEGRNPACCGHTLSRDKVGEEQIALGVHIGGNAMGDLAGGVAEFDAHVVGRGTNPERTSVLQPSRAPEAHMVACAWTTADWLFKGEILAPAEEEEIANGGGEIGLVENGVDGNAETAPETESVCRSPAGGDESEDHVFLEAHQSNVERVASLAVGGMGESFAVNQIRVFHGLALSQPRQEEVGSEQVNANHQKRDPREATRSRTLWIYTLRRHGWGRLRMRSISAIPAGCWCAP